jgi:hypothetical protein
VGYSNLQKCRPLNNDKGDIGRIKMMAIWANQGVCQCIKCSSCINSTIGRRQWKQRRWGKGGGKHDDGTN